mmetsp:Transcript_27184/g.84226  ORF Transcript_27184/g.84226 Transcript_27184/m.84226 type:complete len:138 (-) Transcript_27184:683-1096(-)
MLRETEWLRVSDVYERDCVSECVGVTVAAWVALNVSVRVGGGETVTVTVAVADGVKVPVGGSDTEAVAVTVRERLVDAVGGSDVDADTEMLTVRDADSDSELVSVSERDRLTDGVAVSETLCECVRVIVSVSGRQFR